MIELATFVVKLIRRTLGTYDGECQKPEEISWEQVYAFCKKHYLCAMLHNVVAKELEGEVKVNWQRSYNKALSLDLQQLLAYEEILSFAKDNNLYVVPLKGLRIKELYPHTHMRTMSDLDILFEIKDYALWQDYFKENGYEQEIEAHEGEAHHVFTLGDVHVEFHQRLMGEELDWEGYFNDIWGVIEKKDGIATYPISDEYIFLLMHFYKHYYESGSGLRYIIDFYLYEKKYKDQFDYDYILNQLKKLDILCLQLGERAITSFFENVQRQIERFMLLDDIVIDKDGEYIINSGVYGNLSQRINNGIKRKGRRAYFWSRIFPPKKVLASSYPVLKRHGWLYFACATHRLVKCLFIKRYRQNATAQLRAFYESQE